MIEQNRDCSVICLEIPGKFAGLAMPYCELLHNNSLHKLVDYLLKCFLSGILKCMEA